MLSQGRCPAVVFRLYSKRNAIFDNSFMSHVHPTHPLKSHTSYGHHHDANFDKSCNYFLLFYSKEGGFIPIIHNISLEIPLEKRYNKTIYMNRISDIQNGGRLRWLPVSGNINFPVRSAAETTLRKAMCKRKTVLMEELKRAGF